MLVGQQIGPFEIEKELGSGAMGTVYRAKFHKDEEKVVSVALKVVALGLLGNEGAMARFDREANILKQLRHPHIVKLIATGHWRKTPFIAMEFIDGEALDRALARRGRLSWEEVVAHGKQLCDALQYAHEKGIIHRDLKPSNLMITREGILKLTDFGIAKDTDVTALTGMNSTIGTAAYMSPEQCKGDKNLTAKSDLYSLGIVFFELLTGRKPFTADTTVDMFLKHVNEPAPRIDKLVPDLPPKLGGLILQLLEKDKEDRPADAAWVKRMLLEIEDDAHARKSAGLDAATARRVDRPRGADDKPIDESDREIARLLKGKKKKKKKSSGPLLEQKWFKATTIILGLVGLGLIAYLFLRPPSASKLYAAIEDAKTPDAKLLAAEEYLRQYGEKPGEFTDKAAEVFREGKVREREKQLHNRLERPRLKDDPGDDDPQAYTAAMKAIQAEQEGRLADAEPFWKQVETRFPDEAKLSYTFDEEVLKKARWGWLARKRLRDLEGVTKAFKEVKDKIEEIRKFETPKPDVTSPLGLAVQAERLGVFKDYEKARRTWDTLIAEAEKDPEQRVWLLLALQQRRGLPKEPSTSPEWRRDHLAKQLDTAQKSYALYQTNPNNTKARQQARWIWRDVVDLYDDSEAGRDKLSDKVAEAKEHLKKSG